MKLQYASDIHLEFYKSKHIDSKLFETLLTPTKAVDALVLAGDIGYPEDRITKEFLGWCCSKWRYVIWVFGNHEYYTTLRNSKPMKEKEEIAMDYCKEYTNLHVLHNKSLQSYGASGVKIIGTTLWTKIPQELEETISSYMNDCKYIETTKGVPFTTADWNTLYEQNVEFLQRELDDAHASGLKSIVVTHHLPSFKCIQSQYKDSPVNCGFASDLESLLQHPGLVAWICGHSHGQKDIRFISKANQEVLVSYNARGYPGERSVSTYNPTKVLEV